MFIYLEVTFNNELINIKNILYHIIFMCYNMHGFSKKRKNTHKSGFIIRVSEEDGFIKKKDLEVKTKEE